MSSGLYVGAESAGNRATNTAKDAANDKQVPTRELEQMCISFMSQSCYRYLQYGWSQVRSDVIEQMPHQQHVGPVRPKTSEPSARK